ARRADGTPRRYHGMDARIEHADQCVNDYGTATRVPFGEYVRALEHHGPNDLLGQRISYAARMRPNQVHLQLAELLGCNDYVRECAETGIDAIDDLAAFDYSLDQAASSLNGSPRTGRESDCLALRRFLYIF